MTDWIDCESHACANLMILIIIYFIDPLGEIFKLHILF